MGMINGVAIGYLSVIGREPLIVVLHGQTAIFAQRRYRCQYISTPREKGSGRLPLAYLCQPPSGMLGLNCLPIKHRCLFIYYRSRDMYTTTSLASKEVVIEYAVCEKGLETHGMIR